MLWRICIAGLVLLAIGSRSFASCYTPDAPSCASGYGNFDDEYEFDRCKGEMETYKSEVEDYISCLKREVQRLNSQGDGAISDYNDAVASFNRRAGG